MSIVHVVLVGPMAVGKSTVARALGDRLGWPVRDSDDDLQRERGFSGRELAAAAGVAALHRWESAHLRRAVAATSPSVVAAAASVVDDPLSRDALADQFVVWLQASAVTRAERMSQPQQPQQPDHRRTLGGDPVEALASLDEGRAEGYEGVADLVVDAGDATPDQIVATICDRMPVPLPGRDGDLRS
jgi:shikimate kinase